MLSRLIPAFLFASVVWAGLIEDVRDDIAQLIPVDVAIPVVVAEPEPERQRVELCDRLAHPLGIDVEPLTRSCTSWGP